MDTIRSAKQAAKRGVKAKQAKRAKRTTQTKVRERVPSLAGAAGRAAARAQAATVSLALAEGLGKLQIALRSQRLLTEPRFADELLIWPSDDAAGYSAQVLDALNAGNIEPPSSEAVPGASLPDDRKRPIQTLAHIGTKRVVTASPSALLAMRSLDPGLRVAQANWAYLQYVRPLGDELAAAAKEVTASGKARQFTVRFTTAGGTPMAGLRVRAVLEWGGRYIAATTDENGAAIMRVPLHYPRIETVMVEPPHTYWPVYTEGFNRVDAPKRLDLLAELLVPDGYQLLGHYATYEPDAGKGVAVGVIDSGVGPHPALTVAGGRCVVTGEDENDWADNGIGHGTHVAGIIAGARVDGSDIYGIAPACILRAYRACPRTGETDRALSSNIAAAIERAIDDKCDLVNISLGSGEAMTGVPDTLEEARQQGMVIIAATGNDGKSQLRYPARYSQTLAVAALGRDATFPTISSATLRQEKSRQGEEFVAAFSNSGVGTDFIGPGVAVLSTYPGGKYAMMSGTSMATPFITGMAARILSKHPEVLGMARSPQRSDAIVKLLTQSTRKIGWSDEYDGFGVIMEK